MVYRTVKSVWARISNKRRYQSAYFIGLTLISSIAEVGSIGIVVPLIALITTSDGISESDLLFPLLDFLGFSLQSESLTLVIVGLFAFAVIAANSFRLVLAWANIRLSNSIISELSTDLFLKVLVQPYQKHFEVNTSEIIATITQKINLTAGVLISAISIVSSAILFLAMFSTLLIIDYQVSLAAFVVFFLSYAVLRVVTKKRLVSNSRVIEKLHNKTIKVLQEGLGSIRDVILDSSQIVFSRAYKSNIDLLQAAGGQNTFIAIAPKYIMESIGFLLIALLIIFSIQDKSGVESMLPVLGAVALAAQRMLPLIQQIYSNWASITGNVYVVDSVVHFLDLPLAAANPDSNKIDFRDAIEFRNVRFVYSNATQAVLNEASFLIKKGSCIGIIGETGSGKSTLLDLLMGLLEPSTGQIFIDDIPLSPSNISRWRSSVAHVPQTIYLSDSTIAENIAFGVPQERINYDMVADAAEKAMISDFINSCSYGYETLVGERGVKLSGGQRQRIGIARALYKNSPVIILDEATSALDVETEALIMSSISKLVPKVTVVMVTHRLTTLTSCSEILKIENGRIICVSGFN